MSPPLTAESFVSAVAAGRVDELLRVLDEDCNAEAVLPTIRDRADSHGDSAVALAVRANNLDMLRVLLERCGCDPNGPAAASTSAAAATQQQQQQSPLHVAARQGFTGAIAMLCKHGADPNRKFGEQGWTPLHVSCFHKKAAASIALLTSSSSSSTTTTSKCPLDICAQTDAEGATALHLAAAQGEAQVVREILRFAAAATSALPRLLSLRTKKGETVMHSALLFNMSKSFGGRFPVPETQWELALWIALAGCGSDGCIARAGQQHQQQQETNEASTAAEIEPATFYMKQRVPALVTLIDALAGANLDVAATLQLRLSETAATSSTSSSASSLFSFLVGASTAADMQAGLVGCSATAAEKLIAAAKELDEQRRGIRQSADAAAAAAAAKKKSTVLESVVGDGHDASSAAAATTATTVGSAEDAEIAKQFVNPHGNGIDVRSIREGDDPSNGACPFLKMRAEQARAREERKSAAATASEAAPAARSERRGGDFAVRFGIAAVSFAAGWVACRIYDKIVAKRK